MVIRIVTGNSSLTSLSLAPQQLSIRKKMIFLFISIVETVSGHDGDHNIVNGQKFKRN